MVCSICNKTSSYGISQRHGRGVAGRRWSKRAQATKRMFAPNIQAKTFVISGVNQKLNVCTRCLKRIKKSGSIGKIQNIAVA